jgi:hypothetical protein
MESIWKDDTYQEMRGDRAGFIMLEGSGGAEKY